MSVPLSTAQLITQNDSGLKLPLLDFLLWLSQPGVTESPEYDEVLDFLCVELPGFHEWRDEQLKSRVA